MVAKIYLQFRSNFESFDLIFERLWTFIKFSYLEFLNQKGSNCNFDTKFKFFLLSHSKSQTHTVDQIISIFGGDKADLVVSDGAPDAIGSDQFDEYIQHELVLSVSCELEDELLIVVFIIIAKQRCTPGLVHLVSIVDS